jgi:hypothetical protein
MKRLILQGILSVAIVLGLSASAQAKDPFNQLQDLQGAKLLRTKGPLVKQALSVEFMPVSGSELLLVHESQVVPVRVLGYGSGHFQWNMGGLTYEIANYPLDNKSKPVSGLITNSDGDTQKFRLYTKKVPKPGKKESQAHGRWVGELAFPGGAMLDFSVDVARVSWSFSGCKDGVAYMHVSYSGAPSQPASLMHCVGMVPNGDYYASFFHWDNTSGDIFFITINGDITSNGQLFQGQATASSLTNGTSSEGKFLLFRHQPFAL